MSASARPRLLALDLDGTLLDPYGALTDGVREAVAVARGRGLHVVLCTGRRFRTALPLARDLGLDGAIVVYNGVLVKDLASGATLHQRFLSAELYPEVLALLRRAGPPLVYLDSEDSGADMLTENPHSAHPFQREYLAANEPHYRTVPDLAASRPERVVMLSLMANPEVIAPLRQRARTELGDRIETCAIINKNYQGHILECLAAGTSKWAALAQVAEDLGIGPDEIAAVGDDQNDVELLRRAGFGIAMGNAVPEARAAADAVVRSNAEGGAIEAIERVLLRL